MSERRPQDREICLCFHVPLGKIAKFVRLRKPRHASQISQCYGAGTGCGWCIPFLEKIHQKVLAGEDPAPRMSPDEYRERRKAYHKKIGYGAEKKESEQETE